MKVAIMQPYLFPYIGYFQLINSVDVFVIYDDVNYIKGGWINRNKILLNNSAFMISIPIIGASSFKKINEINLGNFKENKLATIKQAYYNAPNYNEIIPIVTNIFEYNDSNLAAFISNSIYRIIEYLSIKTEIILSSNLSKREELKGQDKVIDICKILKAKQYINSIGGLNLYNRSLFLKEDIQLSFLKSNLIEYKQFNNIFIPSLSIIDILMFNSKEEIKEMLNQYELI